MHWIDHVRGCLWGFDPGRAGPAATVALLASLVVLPVRVGAVTSSLVQDFDAIPADSAGARAAFVRRHDAAFRIAFDSLLACAPRRPGPREDRLRNTALAHAAAVKDSVLVWDTRTTAPMRVADRRQWLGAVRADAAAWVLYRGRRYEAGADSFRTAVRGYHSVGDLRREAVAWGSLGLALWGAADWPAAAAAFETALERRQRLGDRVLVGRALRSLGLVEDKLGRPRDALAHFEAALAVRAADGDRTWDGRTRIYIAHDLIATLQPVAARAALERASADFAGIAGPADHCDLLLAWARLHMVGGDAEAALATYAAIDSMSPPPGAAQRAAAKDGQGAAWRKTGNFARALAAFAEADSLWRSAGDDYNLAVTVNAAAGVYLDLADLAAAAQSLDEARVIAERSHNTATAASIAANRAMLAQMQGRLADVRGLCEEARALAVAAGDSALLSDTLYLEGKNELMSGATSRALAAYEKLLEFDTACRSTVRVMEDVVLIGNLFGVAGRYDEARSKQRTAAAMARRLRRPDVLWKTQFGMGDVYEREGMLDSARIYNAMAIETLESLRRGDLADARRISLLSAQGWLYQSQIEVLRKLALQSASAEPLAAAFETTERFKARGLLDLLLAPAGEAAAAHTPAVASLRALDGRLSAERRTLRSLAAEGIAADSLAVHDARISRLESERTQLLDQVQAENPKSAAFGAGKPFALDEIQKRLLAGRKTVLLEYVLADSATYLWTVTAHAAQLVRLAPKVGIDSCVQRYRALLRDPHTGGPAFAAASQALTRLLLTPAQSELRKAERVLIVPDGSLHGLPFETLFEAPAHEAAPRLASAPSAGAGRAAGEQPVPRGVALAPSARDTPDPAAGQPFPAHPRYALDGRTVCYGPSATVLAVLDSHRSAPGGGAPGAGAPGAGAPGAGAPGGSAPAVGAPGTGAPGGSSPGATTPRRVLLAVGRPAFDPRGVAPDSAQRSAGDARLPPLPFSGIEVERIAALLPGGAATVLLDRDADENRVRAPECFTEHAILHFATHAVVDEQAPERSNLVLAFPRDASEDGLLHAEEIYGLRTGAALVVLSACETGLGRVAASEGVLGLPRAFFFAGATAVVTSLWSVADESTAQFMVEFYRSMLRAHESPAAALARARHALRRDPRFAHPYYWGPFVFEGPDPGPLPRFAEIPSRPPGR